MEWISIEDRLPEFGTDVLVFDEVPNMVLSAILNDGVWVDTFDEFELETVTHWSELPEPPKTK